MTKNFSDLIYLLNCSVNAAEPEIREFDFKKLYELSLSQQIQTLVFPSINRINKKDSSLIEEKLFLEWQKQFLFSVMFAERRKIYVKSLIEKFNRENINYCILKGETLSILYAEPESRISSDVDILVSDKEEFIKAKEILMKEGFLIINEMASSHQLEFVHKIYGTIELHSDICDGIAKKIWFENKIAFNEPYITVKDKSGYEYKSLSATDGGVYVTFHFIKHFLSHGCGIRQMLDSLLYLKAYEKEMDVERFENAFSNLRYLKFIEACKKVGNVYFGMDFSLKYETEETVIEKILSDMESGGIFGKDEEFRKSFTVHYTNRRKVDDASHKKETTKWLFERISEFARNRNYNIIKIIKDLIKKNKTVRSDETSEKINERLDLFENLGFFEEKGN